MPIRDPDQAELLAWSPPQAVKRFEPHRVRAATITGQVKRAIAETLHHQADAGITRERVAEMMGNWLGEEVPKSALDAWASEAREEHLPSIVRFAALLAATLDPRLLQVVADQCGWAVVHKKYLPLIELASLREHEDAVRKRRQGLQAHARISGAL